MTDLAAIICCKGNRHDSWINRSHTNTNNVIIINNNNNNNNNNNHNNDKKMIKFSTSFKKTDQPKWCVKDSPTPPLSPSPIQPTINDSIIMLKSQNSKNNNNNFMTYQV